MRALFFYVLLCGILGDVFPTSTTREGILPNEEKTDVNEYFENVGAAAEDNLPGVSPWMNQVTEGNETEEYDDDLINDAIQDTTSKSLEVPPESWTLSNEEQQLDIGNSTVEEISTQKGKPKRKFSSRKESFNKLRKYGRRMKSKSRMPQLKGNWKKTCCSFGKKIGNSESTYLAENLFDECAEKTRNLSSSKITRQCKLIFMSCCENRALRRYYAEHKLNSTLAN